VDEDVERPELLDLSQDAVTGDVAADEQGLGAAGSELVGRSLRRAVVSQVADRDAGGAEVGEPQGDRTADAS
jgi:hypothetical protein